MIKPLVWIHTAAGIPAFAQVPAFSAGLKGRTGIQSRLCKVVSFSSPGICSFLS